ncbi:MAG: hypothetical protein KC472_09515, partial [Dehalococcoidia bacterium]|nr:hypothetical protein [Dehalococcoidia bacterium]
MALDPDAVRWLRTPEGAAAARDAVAALAAGTPLLKLIDTLRRTHTAEEARWAVTLAEGRTTAAAKFTDASELFFDREAAEQATSDVVSRYTAR